MWAGEPGQRSPASVGFNRPPSSQRIVELSWVWIHLANIALGANQALRYAGSCGLLPALGALVG